MGVQEKIFRRTTIFLIVVTVVNIVCLIDIIMSDYGEHDLKELHVILSVMCLFFSLLLTVFYGIGWLNTSHGLAFTPRSLNTIDDDDDDDDDDESTVTPRTTEQY